MSRRGYMYVLQQNICVTNSILCIYQYVYMCVYIYHICTNMSVYIYGIDGGYTKEGYTHTYRHIGIYMV